MLMYSIFHIHVHIYVVALTTVVLGVLVPVFWPEVRRQS